MTMRDDDDPPRPADLEPLALEYRGPAGGRPMSDSERRGLRLIRRLVFAVGLAFLAGGVGSAIPGHDGESMMACGGGLVGLCLPLGRWSRD